MDYLLYKTLHIIFMVTWMAGLFYLPRLFVYHAMSDDTISHERFKIMERKLLWGICTPGGLLTLLFGGLLWWRLQPPGYWLHAKVGLVALLVVYHVWCVRLVADFRADRNRHSHVWYRWFNEFPVLILVGAVVLVIFRPF